MREACQCILNETESFKKKVKANIQMGNNYNCQSWYFLKNLRAISS